MVHYTAADIDAALDRLQTAGTLDAYQVKALRTELAAGSPRNTGVAGRPATALLVAVYVGVALVVGGVATLIATNWDDLVTATRVLIFGAMTVGLLVTGAMLREQLDVGCGLAWLVAVPAAGGLGAAVAGGIDIETETRFLVATATAVACALVLLALRRSAAQTFGFVASWIVGDIAVAIRADYDATGAGWLFVVTGAALLVVAVMNRIPTPDLAFALGGLVTLGGIHLLADDRLGFAVVIAVALCAVGYHRAANSDPAVPLVVATLTVASVTPRLLGDSVGASGMLAFTGVVVLLVVAVHVRLSRRYNRQRVQEHGGPQ